MPKINMHPRNAAPSPTHPQSEQLNMIMGGLQDCNDSIRSIRMAERRAAPAKFQSQTSEFDPYTDKLSFYESDATDLHFPHNDPLVIDLQIVDHLVSRVLVDTGSTVDLIFRSTLYRMGIPITSLKPVTRPLTDFSGRVENTIGTIELTVTAGRMPRTADFVVIDTKSPYNAIMGTPWIHGLKAVVSTYHQCMKFPTPYGISTIRGNQQVARACFIQEHRLRHAALIDDEVRVSHDLESSSQDAPPRESLQSVNIDPSHPERCVKIGTNLAPEVRTDLVSFLQTNVSTFAWTTSDMKGIDPAITSHELHVDPAFKPVKQKRRKLGTERTEAVNNEVRRLLAAGAIQEVQYPDWLANPVVVKKKNGKWRVCIDFTDLNKACPKDSFPLPHVDQLVESTAGNELISFMDAFSGYNQIAMHPDDREKTAFVTNLGTYCYKVMPFGLKNAGATYQRLVNSMFADQIGKTMEVYIDDMLVKSAAASSHVDDLARCFQTLNSYNMKLNPAKCSFGVISGEFLGYIVTQRGIEASTAKIRAIREMPSPRNIREVQRLTGRVAALTRFISKSTDKCLPFYQLLKNNRRFQWDEACEQAFLDLKKYLTDPPVLAKPLEGETLYLYVATTNYAVSGVLVQDDRGNQTPIYYVSKSLDDAETRYPMLEKLALAVVMSARKLRPYFQSHSIVVLSNYPLRMIFHSPTQSGRLARWAIELTEFDIEFKGRTAAKSQVLADFLIELPTKTPSDNIDSTWTLFTDGSASQHGSGIGIKIISPTGEILEQSFRLAFVSSNNEAEYEALLAGCRLALELGVRKIQVRCDSQLVVNHLNDDFSARDERMAAYLDLAKKLRGDFDEFTITKIPRGENAAADALALLASTSEPTQKRVIPVEILEEPSITIPAPQSSVIVTSVQAGNDASSSNPKPCLDPDDWRKEIYDFITTGSLPADKWAARRLKVRSAHYSIVNGDLFRWTANGTLLRCITPEQGREVMIETHEGAGGNHSGGRALALKIRKQGFYWPTLLSDCINHARRCDACQRHANIIHAPSEELQASVAPYPFMRWGMDIIGPFPPSRKKQFVLVATDYFTKWVEAESYTEVKGIHVQKFVWKFIICRHGLPHELVTDNGTQFTSDLFEAFCAKWNIRLLHSTPRYPQGNGQAEATNKTIIDGLKKRLDETKGSWAEELDGVLWSHRTTPRRATLRTPFSLTYGIEAMSPAEVGIPTLRHSIFAEDPSLNNETLCAYLDLAEEARTESLLKIQNYQNLTARYYNKKVQGRLLQEGDLVLRQVYPNTEEHNAGKLGTNWEGPYQISKIIKPGVYELMEMTGKQVPRPWNIAHLRKYYY